MSSRCGCLHCKPWYFEYSRDPYCETEEVFAARMKRDQDIEWFDRIKLKSEVRRLRNAIRQHRDQRLDDRCWMDDYELYETLPEGIDPSYVDLRLLPKEVMMKNCEHFVECRTTSLTPAEAIVRYKHGDDIL